MCSLNAHSKCTRSLAQDKRLQSLFLDTYVTRVQLATQKLVDVSAS